MRAMNVRASSSCIVRATALPRVLLAVVVSLTCTAAMSACGSSGSSSGTIHAKVNLDTPHVAKAIKLSILSQRHVHAKVTCPPVVPQEQGRTFVCIATTATGKTPFTVTIQNNKGYVTYKAD